MSLLAVDGPTDVAGAAERVWVVEAGIDHAGIAAVCERFALFAASFAALTPDHLVIVCDVGAITDPDMATLSLLARLQLTARRLGRGIQLHRAQDRLIELILLSGLGAVLPLRSESSSGGEPASCLVGERGRETEQGEEPVHVEEVVDPLDPPV